MEDNQHNAYVIDRAFTRTDKDGSTAPVYLDLYKRDHFVLETKQGSSGTSGKVGPTATSTQPRHRGELKIRGPSSSSPQPPDRQFPRLRDNRTAGLQPAPAVRQRGTGAN